MGEEVKEGRISQLQDNIDRVYEDLDRLDSATTVLESRLSVVLRIEPPKPKPEQDIEDAELVSRANEVRSMAYKIESIIGRLIDITDRLEV